MKTLPNLASLLAALALLPATQSKAADVSVSLFYDNLDPYGEWVEVGDYGYCWHPRDVDNDWRPYTNGNWAYTDAGWTWVSDEPYGWAVYHYGRWARTERVGWVWVPDTEWAPAWVSWRNNDRYVGWAPLPPESRVSVGVSIGGWVDATYDIGPTYYSFVQVRDLGAPRLRSVIVPPRDNITIINQTTNITNITYKNNVVINNGPDYNIVSRQTANPIRRLKLDRRTERSERMMTKVEGDSLVVAAPTIQKAADAKPKKVAQKIEKASLDRGWKNAGDAEQVKTARAKVKAEAKDAPADIKPVVADTDSTTSPTSPTADPAKPGDKPAPGVAETAPQRGKGKMREGGRATPETAPADPAATPEDPKVAAQPDQRQRGKGGAKKNQSLDPVAEAPEKPADAAVAQPDRPADADRPNRGTGSGQRERGDAPNRAERPEQPSRPQQPDRPDRPNQPERLDRPEQPARPDRPDRPEQPARPERADRPDVPERPNRPERPDRPQGAERQAQPDRPAKPERPERPNPAAAAEREVRKAGREAAPQAQPPQNRPPQPGAEGGGKQRDAEGQGKKKAEQE